MELPDSASSTLQTYLENVHRSAEALIPVDENTVISYRNERTWNRDDGQIIRRISVRLSIPREYLSEDNPSGVQWLNEVVEDEDMQELGADIERLVSDELNDGEPLRGNRLALDQVGVSSIEFKLALSIEEREVSPTPIVSVSGSVPFTLEFDPEEQNPMFIPSNEPTDEELLELISESLVRENPEWLTFDSISIQAWDTTSDFSPTEFYLSD